MTERAEPEPVLLRREDLDVALQVSVAGGTAVAFSRRSPGADRDNQDAAALVPLGRHRGVLAVADGAGGHAAGAEASATALEAILDALVGSEDSEDGLRPAILDGIERANDRVSALAGGAATTLALVEIDAGTIRPYHVGDSEILVTGQRGRLKLHIVPHSPTGYGIESGLLDEEAAIVHEDRHFVSNVVGSREMRIEVGPTLRAHPRDTVLLASDGLFDNLLQEEILEIVRCGPLAKAAEELAGMTHARMKGAEPRGKPDDLTFVLWRPLLSRDAKGWTGEARS